MPTHIWTTAQHIEREPQIGGSQPGLGFESREDQTQNPIIGDSQEQPDPFCGLLAWHLFAKECSDI
jgi:hypothetical protein